MANQAAEKNNTLFTGPVKISYLLKNIVQTDRHDLADFRASTISKKLYKSSFADAFVHILFVLAMRSKKAGEIDPWLDGKKSKSLQKSSFSRINDDKEIIPTSSPLSSTGALLILALYSKRAT